MWIMPPSTCSTTEKLQHNVLNRNHWTSYNRINDAATISAQHFCPSLSLNSLDPCSSHSSRLVRTHSTLVLLAVHKSFTCNPCISSPAVPISLWHRPKAAIIPEATFSSLGTVTVHVECVGHPQPWSPVSVSVLRPSAIGFYRHLGSLLSAAGDRGWWMAARWRSGEV